MEKETILKIIKLSKERKTSEKEICTELGVCYKTLYYYKIKFNIKTTSRGKNPNSRTKRTYSINDNFFNRFNTLSAYWAGFIAADGNISQDCKKLAIGLSIKDKNHLLQFLKDVKSNYKISEFLTKKKYKSCSITIVSSNICKQLLNKYNITPNKSLTLLPPNLTKDILIDSFIIGYIDGDGCTQTNIYKNGCLIISILGTLSMCIWIKNRISKIYGKQIGCISHDKKHHENTYSLTITNKAARVIFKHLYNINVPKLSRKWKDEYYDNCINFIKKRKINSKYEQILKLKQMGFSQTEIAKQFNMTPSNVNWYYKQNYFKKLEGETKQLDKGETNIEEEN